MLEFVANRQVLTGPGVILELPDVVRRLHAKKVFLAVFMPGADCVKQACKALEDAKIPYVMYDKVVGEPDLEVIDTGAAICKAEGCDCVAAIGGGSVIDTAKAVAIMATNEGCVEDYQLNRRSFQHKPLAFIAVPTTAGTGAEATKVSVIFNPKLQWKKSIYSNDMIAQTVLLDPTATVGLPPRGTASTGMDAITHAIESYISLNANAFSRMYSLYALKILYANIETACREPENLEARQNMLLGSYFAGCAISAGTCLAHQAGQPIGAMYHIAHGDACSILLMPSLKLNMDYCMDAYKDIVPILGIRTEGRSDMEIVQAMEDLLYDLCRRIGAPTRLTQFVKEEEIDMEALLDNIQTSMGHLKNNPRPVSRELFEALIRAAL